MLHRASPAPAPGIRIERVRPAVLSSLAPAWDALRERVAADGATAGPFLAAEWFAALGASLGGGEVLLAWRGRELVGALPLLRERRRLGGLPARVLRSLSDDHSQRFDALVADEAVADELAAQLAGDRSVDVIELRDAPVGEPTGVDRIVAACARRGLAVERWTSQTSPYLPLPEDLAALDRALDAKFRANVRRRGRRLAEELGPLELEWVRGTDGLRQALADGLALEAAGWKGEAGTAIACDRPLRIRYERLAEAFAGRGELALAFLRAGGRRIAFHYALESDGRYFLFKPGFDPELARHGPGHLLVDLVARDLVRRGVRELDFLGDDMPWKREWTERARPHAWRYVFRGPWGALVRLAKFRAGPWARDLARRLRQVGAPSAG